ncbi:MAG: alpha-2-macroglobulin family protein [Bacteroidota bacterium]
MRVYIFTLFLLLGSSFISSAQNGDTILKKEWIEIDTLILKKDLTRTALQKTNLLYQKAKQRNLPAHQVKALIYQFSLQDRINVPDPNYIFKTLESEIKTTTNQVQKAILYALLAKSYRQYYNDRRYALYRRQNTTKITKEDIGTWTADDLIDAVKLNYFRSLEPKKLLQAQLVETYNAAIISGNSRNLRPTLYDLLANDALDFFKSGDVYSTKPVNTFVINDPKALGTMDVFINADFKTKDSSSQKWIGLQLFQQLVSFHRNDADKEALLDINLARIEWVNQQAIFFNKEAAYLAALEEITSKYPSATGAAQAWYLLAKIESDKAAGYQPLADTTNRYGYIKAKSIIAKAVPLFKEPNRGTANMQNLLVEMNRKDLQTQTEKVNVPKKDFRALVKYRNIDTLYGRIIRIDQASDIRNNPYGADYWKKVAEIKSYQAFVRPLPKTYDHQTHNVEIKMDGLPVGEYAVLSSSSRSFSDASEKLCIQFFYVSNISYIKTKNDFFVLNREDGKPMPDVKVSIIKQEYISRLQKTIEDTTIRRTDKNGHFSFAPNKYGNFRYLFTTAGDRLFFQENDYNLYFDNADDLQENSEAIGIRAEQLQNRIFFFTDRAIYRPGQTVFFKGIGVTRDYKTKLSKLIISKDSGWVYLRDANNKLVDSLKFALNSYGSFAGKFQIPQNLLTGRFAIQTQQQRFNYSATSFQVEEYKRPNFSVSFEKVKGAYRLNDSIVITGIAKAYAGNFLYGAKVTYNVMRNVRYQDMWTWRRPMQQPNGEIGHGELITDAEGKFTIKFKAEADDIMSREGNPLFDFAITANVTDINGETRSTNTKITTGFSSLLIQLSTPAITETDSLKKINLLTTNLSNEKEPANVKITIYPLQTPERLIRKRYWTQPDQFIFSEKEFIQNFPTDEYVNETNYLTWPVGKSVLTAIVNTADNEAYNIPAGSLAAGYYKIEAIAKDKYGEEVKQVRYTQLFDRKTDQLPMPSYLFNYTTYSTNEPLQPASFLTGTSANNVFVISKIEKAQQVTGGFDYNYRKAGLRNIQYTPTENDRGGVSINEAYVFDNRIYTTQYTIDVPWSNKKLQVSYASYRDKTEPGAAEKWTVSIQGSKGEKVAAELLTGMYDASLDQFGQPNNWAVPYLWANITPRYPFMGNINFTAQAGINNWNAGLSTPQPQVIYDRLTTSFYDIMNHDIIEWKGDIGTFPPLAPPMASEDYDKSMQKRDLSASMMNLPAAGVLEEVVQVRGAGTATGVQPLYIVDGKPASSITDIDPNDIASVNVLPNAEAVALYGPAAANGVIVIVTKGNKQAPVQVRKNFNETAFFFPQLYADSSGKYSFSFTMPESLTQWKWMSLAHTRDLAFGSYSTNIITQKKLMVQSNAPRFMREGDNMEFSSKIVNLTDKEITGQVSLELVDPVTNNSIDGWFQNVFPSQFFTVEAGQSFAVKFPIQIPFGYNRPLSWRIKARAGEFSDGEENTLPVLTNRILVTESLPLYLPSDTTKSFVFDKLLKSNSESLTHEGLTIEYTSNPVWYAVQALPYLMEYPYECAEQTFNRFYANALASYIINKNPRIKQVFEQWKKDSSSLKSNLQKNEELKQILLQETPWVMQAESEEQQKKNLALLFDLAKIGAQTDVTLAKLTQMQLPNGSFSWFKGGGEDRYITNYILTGIGKLKRLGALSPEAAAGIRIMLVNALKYMDGKIAEDYNWLIKNKADLNTQHISSFQIDYLYMRSFFRDIAQQSQKEYDYYFGQGKKFWVKQNSYYKAELGLIYYRNSDEKFATGTVLPALLENTVIDSKQGMYWKTTHTGFWYQSPIEHQSMMIAFMSEINMDQKNASISKNIDAMKTWLLLNKQTNNWRTTIATADACYALLLNGSDWLNADKTVTIQLGKTVISSATEKTEAGTGYFKKRIDGEKVKPEMGNVTVSINSPISRFPNSKISSSPSWGSIYWQYFEEMNKITSAASPLSLIKKLFIERNTDKGKVLEPVKDNEELKTGDKIIVRIELRSDRDMDYLHLKDMRAASMEPVNVLSGYKWQDGLGYYESTKDASTNFFIDHLRKGTYVFDYPLFITHTGIFSVGIATIQCMYAPEFTSHSEGIKIRVAK